MIAGSNERASPPGPAGPAARLTSLVVAAETSRTKMSPAVSSSSPERLSAFDWKATKRPSPEMATSSALPSPPGPVGPSARLTRVVAAASKSRTKTSAAAASSSAERLPAVEMKATARPSAESAEVEHGGVSHRARRSGRAIRERGRGGVEVAHEEVGLERRGGGREIVRGGRERDDATVGRDRGRERVAVAAGAARGRRLAAHQGRRLGLQVADEDVLGPPSSSADRLSANESKTT